MIRVRAVNGPLRENVRDTLLNGAFDVVLPLFKRSTWSLHSNADHNERHSKTWYKLGYSKLYNDDF